MGNAFIAVADDATAASWNPAGLLQLQVPELSFAIESNVVNETMNSSNPEARSDKTIDFTEFNYASLVLPFTFGKNMMLSLNYLRLYQFDKTLNFSAVSPEEISAVFDFQFDQAGSLSALAPAYGVAILDNLFVGLTVNIWNDSLTQSSAWEKTETTVGTASIGNLQQSFRSEVTNRFEVDEGYSVVIGALYRINDRFSVATVVKPPYDLDIDHTRRDVTVQTNEISDPVPDPSARNAELSFPWIIGAGVVWKPNKWCTFSSDWTWTSWSDYTFTAGDLTTNPVSNRPIGEGRLRDTFVVRAGGEWLWINDDYVVPIRWGAGYDPSPAVDDVDDFYTINLGTGIQINDYNLDIGYQFRWGNDVNSDIFKGIDASEDIREHRVLASLIYYF